MTTVTQAAKRLVRGEDDSAIRSGDLVRICSDPTLAQRFARQLAEAAREIAPGREWTPEDLRDLLEAAVRGPRQDEVPVLEGRFLRKRLREQCALAERYGDPFGVIVVALAPEPTPGAYASVLDAIVENLRRTDMVFLYRRRYAIVLPRIAHVVLPQLGARLRTLIDVGVGARSVEDVQTLAFPDPELPDTNAVLDWAEDRLRSI